MNHLTTDKTIRLSKATLMLFFSIFGLLVMYSNFTDYPNNYEYMGHLLSMDTVRHDKTYEYRAITSPMAHHRIYWLIITLEVISTCFCLMGACHLYKNIHSSAAAFHEAKKCSLIGLLIALSVYYVGFHVIGVEWFNMDESDHWNYNDWSRDIVDFIMAALIYIAIKIEG